MKIIEGLDAVAEDDRGASAAIGNFDGVHRGHQAVLDLARRAPNNPGAPLGVVTFEPHPREVFAPGAPPFRLMRIGARADRLAELGVDRLFVIPFDTDFSSLTAEAFCAEVIAGARFCWPLCYGDEDCRTGATCVTASTRDPCASSLTYCVCSDRT